jgi:hypothetical protein
MVLVVILLIYVAVCFGRDYPMSMCGLVAVCGYFLLRPILGTEHLTQPYNTGVDTRMGGENVDDDQYMGEGENIRLSEVDTALQRPTGLNLSKGLTPTPTNSEIDTSDVLAEMEQRGNTVFYPNGQGPSATTSASLSGFVMHEPGPGSEYSIPMSNKTNVDESLARKQMHRGAMNKKARDGQIRSTRAIFEKYFRDELNENEGRVWYSSEAKGTEVDWRAPY